MINKKIIIHFTVVTFIIAYATAGMLIFFGQFGYRVYNFTYTFEQFAANIPFAIYILSPAIASYFVLKKNKQITGLIEWLKIDKKYGYILSSVFTGIIWIFWHIPLFFIPGKNHGEGLINFGMFAVPCMAFRFFFGAVYKVSGKL